MGKQCIVSDRPAAPGRLDHHRVGLESLAGNQFPVLGSSCVLELLESWNSINKGFGIRIAFEWLALASFHSLISGDPKESFLAVFASFGILFHGLKQ